MRTITMIITTMVLVFFMQNLNAQEVKDSINSSSKKYQLEQLESEKEEIIKIEKRKLKEEVERIDKLESKGGVSKEEAKKRKAEKAKIAALNIENKNAIIENKIALLERGEGYDFKYDNGTKIEIGLGDAYDDKGSTLFGVKYTNERKSKKFDKRTHSNMLFAFGLNNTIIENQSLDDSPYKIGGSKFFEVGWLMSTRVFKNSNALRFRYGFSFQFNGLKPKDNMYFVENGNQTVLETHPQDLKKSKLRMDNLVMPIFFEFGPSTVKEGENYIRYSTHDKFKFGIGGYAGVNIGTRQKLKYKLEDGSRVKDKMKQDYNTNDFIYGLAAYIGRNDVSLYMKYDLNPIFNNATVKQNNVSIGFRLDL